MARESLGFPTAGQDVPLVSLAAPAMLEDVPPSTPRRLHVSGETVTGSLQDAYPFPSSSSGQPQALFDDTFDLILPDNSIDGMFGFDGNHLWESPLLPSPTVTPGTPNVHSQPQWLGNVAASTTTALQADLNFVQSISSAGPSAMHLFSNLQQSSSPKPSLRFDLPDILNLGSCEKRALEYYQSQFADLRSVKGFTWSAYSIFLTTALNEDVVLRFILAVSLRGLSHHSHDKSIWLLGKANLEKGLKLLHRILLQDEPDHLVVMVSFWLLVLCTMDNGASVTGLQRRDLSAKIHDYVSTHRLYDRCSSIADDGVVKSNGLSDNEIASQSLVYKLLGMIIYADVQLNFNSHGGKLSEFLSEGDRMQSIQQISRNYLHLNHGNRYPSSELIYDVESIECFNVYHEQHRLYHLLNQLFWFGIGNYRSIQGEIDTLEAVSSASFINPNLAFQEQF